MSDHRILCPVDDAKRPLFAGVDVGGTSIKIGLVDDEGRTIAFASIPTDEARGCEDAVCRTQDKIVELLKGQSLALRDITAIGLGTPGTMDIPAGMILEPPNMPSWRDFPIRDRLSELCGRPVAYCNDAGAAAFGESWIGSGREFSSIVLLTLGTGVGGGIIVNNMSIDGVNSHGAECGHIIIDPRDDARLCGCGQTGHLEAYASATGVIKRTEEALAAGRASTLRDFVAAGNELTGLAIANAAEAGDPLALDIVFQTAEYIATGIVTLVHTIDPGAVILGGAMTFGGYDKELGRQFLARITERVRCRVFPTQAANLTIRFASLGSDAGYIGAAGIAREQYSTDPFYR